jgi:hypothetical protein
MRRIVFANAFRRASNHCRNHQLPGARTAETWLVLFDLSGDPKARFEPTIDYAPVRPIGAAVVPPEAEADAAAEERPTPGR